MKKFIFTILLSLVIIVLIDFVFGLTCSYLSTHAKGGDTYSINYIANEAYEDIIILGSSRASHHYIPSIFTDSLNMATYNAGKDGNGIIAMYGRLIMLTSRYKPKVIIYEVTAGFDIEKNDNHKYLDVLKRHYDKNGIDEIFASVDEREGIKMNSNLYRYNTSFIQLISDNIRPTQVIIDGGYKPMFDKLTYEPKKNERNKDAEVIWDPVKKMYFRKLVELCKEKDIKLIFAISPFYAASNAKSFIPVIKFCNENNITLLNHYCDSSFINNKDFFADPSHLNHDGANCYSKIIAGEMKLLLKD